MPEGPFGGPRPFADSEFLIVVGFENGENVMDKLLVQHSEENLDMTFNKALENFENRTFSRILESTTETNENILQVRVIDQLEIRVKADAISMQELVNIGRVSKKAVSSLTGEEPIVIVRID